MIQKFSVLVAISVSNKDSCFEILGSTEGMKEDHESWRFFFVWLKERGLTGVRLIIGDKNLSMWRLSQKSFWMPDISVVSYIFTGIFFRYTSK